MPTPPPPTRLPEGTSPYGRAIFTSVQEWLSWVRATTINSTATPADLRQITCAADRSTVPLVYGEDRIGGLILNVLPSTYNGVSAALIQVLWCHGASSVGVLDMRFNDKPFDYNKVYAYTTTGTEGYYQTAVVAAFAAQGITYADDLVGYTYSVFQIPVNDFNGEVKITAMVRGRAVYDPRNLQTAWNDNPSLCLADFLTNTQYGCGKTVDWSSVATAANANDEMVGSEKRRRLNVSFMQTQSATSIAETLRAYAGVFLLPSPTGIKFVPDRPTTSVYTYRHSEGKIAGIRKLEKRDNRNLPTVVELTYTDRTAEPWRDGEVVVARDGVDVTVPRRVQQVAMPGINTYSQAYREAQERLNKFHTNDLSLVFDAFDIAMQQERGDVITVNHPLWNLDKLFRVADVTSGANGTWTISCEEYDPAGYNDSTNAGPTYPDTGLFDPTVPPSTPTGMAHSYDTNGVRLTWNRNPELSVTEYELRIGGTGWNDATPLLNSTTQTLVGGTTVTWPPTAYGAYTIRIKARTSVGVESATAASYALTIASPTLATLTVDTVGTEYRLRWTDGVASLPVTGYRVERDGVFVANTVSTEFRKVIDWSGSGTVTFTVKPITMAGLGTGSSANLSITAPTQVASFTASTIVNTVIFYWEPPVSPLPIVKYLLKKGTVYASASLIGEKAGDQTFTTFEESSSGDFTYWIAAVDSAGNEGSPRSLTVKVSAPANFKLTQQFNDNFDGTKTNAVLDAGVLYAPVNTTQTFQQHFDTGYGGTPWTTPQAQIDAGFPIYLMPTQATGSYVKTFVANAPVPTAFISVVPTGSWNAGADGTMVPTLEVSANGSSWTSLGNVWEAFATNCQYVRVTISWTSSNGNDLYSMTALTVNLSLQTEIDSGSEDDTTNWTGTPPADTYCTVAFKKAFVDVDSITVTPMTDQRREWAVEFNDVANPLNFKVRMWNPVTGQYVKTAFSWQATGVV